MARRPVVGALCAAAAAVSVAANVLIDTSKGEQPFGGIGAISGGGATSRLLVDYPEQQRSQILDYLFKPNYGASLQIFKVEIGGDSQSTDGTESSHMHSADDLDYNRGYEWWLLKEAKKRNPEIKTYGLPWAFPGWVGGPELSGDPFKHPELTSKYILKWLEGARDVYGINIDYIGVWNERASSGKYAVTLRQELDAAGFANTTIVAKDGGNDICDEMAPDADYQKAVGIVGLHYPSDYQDLSNCRKLNFGVHGGKPIWASEESSSFDDLNGAACWARVITSHWVLQGITASIMWDLVGSYFHGTDWFASSLMTAVEPWSGHFTVPEVLWATAHLTQFTKIGWNLVSVGSGSGQLPQGGFYATYADPASDDWTLMIVKIDEDHAPCTRPGLPHFNVSAEEVTFQLAPSVKQRTVAVWRSNFEQFDPEGKVRPVFERQPDLTIQGDSFTLQIQVGDVYTFSTIREGPQKGAPTSPIPESVPQVPLPIDDDFQSYTESQEARLWSDQIGAFEVHKNEAGKKVMRQMVPTKPIGWSDSGSNGPVTLLGMREWQDLTFSADFHLPDAAPEAAAACIGTRSDQMWFNAVVLCVDTRGVWSLANAGPRLDGTPPSQIYANGTAPLAPGRRGTLTLTTVDKAATGTLEPCGANGRCTLFENVPIRDFDTGFAVMGTNGWHAIEIEKTHISKAGPRWDLGPPGPPGQAGDLLVAKPCATNGLVDKAQAFELLADWGLRHTATGLCVAAQGETVGATLSLTDCKPTDKLQQFRNDYTNVRNRNVPFRLGAFELAGDTAGSVTLQAQGNPPAGSWQSWAYFPNTQQLRNQYVASAALGYPMCLTRVSRQSTREGAAVLHV